MATESTYRTVLAGPTAGRCVTAVVMAALSTLVACGGGEAATSPASTARPEATSTTQSRGSGDSVSEATDAPLAPGAAIQARLADEFQDAQLAAEVFAGLGEEGRQQLIDRVGEDAATSGVLTYRPKPIPAESVDAIIVFSFGYREAADGSVIAGPPNEQLAAAAKEFATEHGVPIYAQFEVGDLLVNSGVERVTSIRPDVDENGQIVYLSTKGVLDKALAAAAGDGVEIGTAGVLCFADHVGRCLMNVRSAGLDAGVPEGVALPSEYDPESAQPWTRTRAAYLATDLAARASS
ncbi:MAG: hypothetical protein KDB20_08460 [Microthrixaceae bacterium]|nr:hypothetical protein [Microthrixaceae bacterium]